MAVKKKPALLVYRQAEGAGNVAHSLAGQPFLGAPAERFDDGIVIDCGEKAEMSEAGTQPRFQPIDLGRDPPHRLAVPAGEPECRYGMGEIGVLAPVQLLALLQVEGGRIARQTAVKRAGERHELLQCGAAVDRQNLNRMWQLGPLLVLERDWGGSHI